MFIQPIQAEKIKNNINKINFKEIHQVYDSIKNYFYLSSKIDKEYFLKILKENLSSNLYNLTGNLLDLSCSEIYIKTNYDSFNNNYLNSNINDEFYNCIVTLYDNNYLYKINFKNINNIDKLKKIKLNTIIFITNLKAKLEKNNENGYYDLIFEITLKTKIFLNINKYNDSLIYNKNYLLNLYLQNKIINFNNNNFITCENIFKLKKLIPNIYLNLKNLLEINFKSNIINNNNSNNNSLINNINKFSKEITIIGLIKNIFHRNQNETIIEINSLLDINTIKIHIFNCKSLYIDLKPNMIVKFNKYQIKINNFFDINIKNIIQSNNEILYFVSDDEIKKFNNIIFKNFKLNENNNIINLLNGVLVRNIQKYFVSFKHIFKIDAFITNNNNENINYSNNINCNNIINNRNFDIKLKGKFLIDDGTYFAVAFLYNMDIVNLFNLNENDLINIENKFKFNGTDHIKIYDKFLDINFIDKEKIKFFYKNNFIVYGVPFLNAKYIEKNKYINLFENIINNNNNNNLNDENNINNSDININKNNNNKDIYDMEYLKQLKEKKKFINGELYFEKNIYDKIYLEKRPCLNIIKLFTLE